MFPRTPTPAASPAPAGRRRDGVGTIRRRLGAAVAVILAASVLPLTGAAVAGAATDVGPKLDVAPSCFPYNRRVYCQQTFSTSGWISTWDLGTVSMVDVTIRGARGGAASDGTAGGRGGEVFQSFAGWGGYAMFRISIGGGGGSGDGPVGGAGGAGGGGAGGNGMLGGGGGGGGATTVTAVNSAVPGASGGVTVGVAPGGGGAANNYPGGDAGGQGGSGPKVVETTIYAGKGPDYCGGAPGTATAGGAPGCSYDSIQGSAGSAGLGGNGASTPTSCSGGSCLLQYTGPSGGGGGGGGIHGGGGGGAADSAMARMAMYVTGKPLSGGGGPGGSALRVVPTDQPASVTLGWYAETTATVTTLTLSAPTLEGWNSVQATAAVDMASHDNVKVGGMVQFAVDGKPYGSPVPLGGSTTLARATTSLMGLRSGDHQISASYLPDGTGRYTASSSAPATLTVRPLVISIAKMEAATTQLLEVNGTTGVVDTWEQTTSGGSIVSNELWEFRWVKDDYGQLINRQTGQCLEVNGTNGAVDTWSCVDGAPNLLWRTVPNPNGGASLQVQSSGEFLAMASVPFRSGTRLAMLSTHHSLTSWWTNQVS